MGVKSRSNFKTMSKEQYEQINWEYEMELCNSCGGELVEKRAEDEIYKQCVDCGSVA